jgi:heme-degrading monooxygenase HmoA
MVVDLVTYRIKKGRQQEFEKHLEEWLRLMRRSRGFIGQVLLRSADDPSEYYAEVRWVNRDYRDRFSAQDDGAVKSLAQQRATLLESPPAHRLLEPA